MDLSSVFKRSKGRLLRLPLHQNFFFVPALIFIVILIFTFVGQKAASTSLDHDLHEAARSKVASFELLLASQLGGYQQILRGGAGLFQGSSDVTNQDFHNYLSAYALKPNYPAVQGIAFAKVFTDDELPDVVSYLADQGIYDYTVRPATPLQPVHAAVIYFQQVASTTINPRAGYDNYSDPNRKAAAFQARDTAATTLTKSIDLSPQIDGKPMYGFNMYLPYYGPNVPTTPAERQTDIQGYVYAAFLGNVFFNDVAHRSDMPNLAFRVQAKDDNQHITTLYASTNFASAQRDHSRIRESKTFHAYNQNWDIDYLFEPNQLVSTVQLRRPAGIMFFGLFSALLITAIIWLLLRGRSRAMALQREQAIELAQDELLSLASHQLRTPATGVKQYLGMLLQGFAGELPRSQRQLLEKAYASNDRQLQSINEILHVAKINSGHITLARQPTDLSAMLRDIIQEQQSEIKNARHKLTNSLPKKPIVLSVDTHMLRMATENVLSNAIKYTLPGGRIAVTLCRRAGNVEIIVKDTGVGIGSEDFPKLFKQFSRLPSAVNRHISGTGVGLFLAKYLVELHGGQITVDSAQGKGATFTIILPGKLPQTEYKISNSDTGARPASMLRQLWRRK